VLRAKLSKRTCTSVCTKQVIHYRKFLTDLMNMRDGRNIGLNTAINNVMCAQLSRANIRQLANELIVINTNAYELWLQRNNSVYSRDQYSLLYHTKASQRQLAVTMRVGHSTLFISQGRAISRVAVDMKFPTHIHIHICLSSIQGGPQNMPQTLSISPPNTDRFSVFLSGTFCGKFVTL